MRPAVGALRVKSDKRRLFSAGVGDVEVHLRQRRVEGVDVGGGAALAEQFDRDLNFAEGLHERQLQPQRLLVSDGGGPTN